MNLCNNLCQVAEKRQLSKQASLVDTAGGCELLHIVAGESLLFEAVVTCEDVHATIESEAMGAEMTLSILLWT